MQAKWDPVEDCIKTNPHLGFTHQSTVEEELHKLANQLSPDAENLLHAYGIETTVIGATRETTLPTSTTPPSQQAMIQPSIEQPPIRVILRDEITQRIHEQIAHEEAHTLLVYLKRNPRPKVLHEWALQVLYRSYSLITMLDDGYFEI